MRVMKNIRLMAMAAVIALLSITLPRPALASNTDEMYVANFVSIVREDDDDTDYRPIDFTLTITYNNGFIEEAESRDFEWEKYLQVRVEKDDGFGYLDPEMKAGEETTALKYQFTLKANQSAAMWIIEDLHRDALQPSVRIKMKTLKSLEPTVTVIGTFRSELQKVKTNEYYLSDATVQLSGSNADEKAGIPNASIKIRQEPPADETENTEDTETEDDAEDTTGSTTDNTTGYRLRGWDTSKLNQTGDAIAPICIGIIAITGGIAVYAQKIHKRRKG